MEWAAGMDLEGQGAGSCKVSSGRNDWMGCFAANSQQAGDQDEDCEKKCCLSFRELSFSISFQSLALKMGLPAKRRIPSFDDRGRMRRTKFVWEEQGVGVEEAVPTHTLRTHPC